MVPVERGGSHNPAKTGGPGLTVPGSGSWCPLLAGAESVAVASLLREVPFQISVHCVSLCQEGSFIA